MKTLWTIVLFILLVGCGGSVSVEPDPPIVLLQPKAEITINPGLGLVVPYGFEVKVSWESENAKYCILNNETVQTSGSIRTKLYENTTYTVKAVNGDLSYTTEKSVTVASWTSSDLGLLSHDYWLLKSMENFQDDQLISYYLLSDNEKLDKTYFKLNGNCESYHSNGVLYGSCGWSFAGNGSRILIGSQEYAIDSLTTNLFVRSMPMVDKDGKPYTLKITLWKP